MNNKIAKKITIHYSAAFFVFFAAFCMIRSFISVYLLDRGFSYTQAGIITGIHMLAAAIIQPNFALILDHFPKGLHHFIAFCCIPAVICSLLTFFLPANLFVFILLYIIFAVCEVGLLSLMVSVGMEYVNAGVPINAGLGRGFGSIGYAAANFLLGGLIVRYGSPVSHKLNIILMLIFAVVIITMPDPETLKSGTRQDDSEKTTVRSDNLFTFLRTNSIFALFTLSVVFVFFGHCFVNTYLPNVAAQFGLGSDFTGAMNALAAGLELIPMMMYAKISKKISPLNLLCISAVFFTVKILTAALATNGTGIVISQLMQLLAYAIYSMPSIYFANQAVQPQNRVMAQGLLIGASEIGFTIGSLVGGAVLDHHTIRVLLWMGVCVSAVGSAMMIAAVTQFRQKSA